jgi:RNA polymerase-binding transcription factor DksA
MLSSAPLSKDQRAGEQKPEKIVADSDRGEFNDSQLSHGLCVRCHAPIPSARLRLDPQAARCIACQTLHERKFSLI